ncbi:hypothetical protein BJX99DRAFT_258267 [Aspergillus californicus]
MCGAEMLPESRQPWSFSSGIALVLLAGVTLVMGWLVLMLPNPLARVVFVFPIAGMLVVFYHMGDVFPDDTANEIWGMSALIWLSHMGHLVYINNDRQYIRPFHNGHTAVSWLSAGQNAFKMLFNCRGLRTSWAIDPAMRSTTNALRKEGSPRSSSEHRPQLGSPQHPVPSEESRLRFCIRRSSLMLGRFVFLCIIPNGLQDAMAVEPADFLPERRSFMRRMILSLATQDPNDAYGKMDFCHEALLRLWTVFYIQVPFWLTLESYHDVFAIIHVAIGLDSPSEWPPLFGSIAEAYTVRGYWSNFWQLLPYRSYGAFSSLIATHVIHLPPNTIYARYTKNLLVFWISGLVHYVTWTRQGSGCAAHSVFLWYLIQPIAFVIEGAVQFIWYRWRGMSRENSTLGSVGRRLVGYIWVGLWMFWSASKIWVSIVLQSFSLGVIWPTGLVLGITNSKWALSIQAIGIICGMVGLWICQNSFTPYLVLKLVLTVLLVFQLIAQLGRRMPSEYIGKSRQLKIMHTHLASSIAVLVLIWIQITAGSLEMLGLSTDYQSTLAHACLSAFLMCQACFWVSSATGLWPRYLERAPEFYDCLWLFSIGTVMIPVLYMGAHLWEGREAVLLLVEHVLYALMVMTASLIGLWLSRRKSCHPKRNLMSSLTWLLLGQLMVSHHQWNPMTKKAHEGFGYSLVGLAAAKALDVLTNSSTPGSRATDIRSLRFLPALFSTLSSLMIIAATWELCIAVEEFGLSPLGYLAGVCSVAFLVYLFIVAMLQYLASSLYPHGDERQEYAMLSTMPEFPCRHTSDSSEA